MKKSLPPTRALSEEIDRTESKLLRSTAAGKSDDESISARVNGRGQVTEITIDQAAYGLSDKKHKALAEGLSQALNAALAKQRRRVDKELSRLLGQND